MVMFSLLPFTASSHTCRVVAESGLRVVCAVAGWCRYCSAAVAAFLLPSFRQPPPMSATEEPVGKRQRLEAGLASTSDETSLVASTVSHIQQANSQLELLQAELASADALYAAYKVRTYRFRVVCKAA